MSGAGDAVSTEQVTRWWRTGISDIEPGVIRLRGYPIEELIGQVDLAEMAWLLLRGDLPTRAQSRLLQMALVAAVDHGPQAPSIAAARMAASCGVGLNNAVATGVNLLGDVHGGAGQQCLTWLVDIADRVDAAGPDCADVVADRLREVRARGERVPGFGHRFHPRDPRRDPLVAAVRDHVAEFGGGRYLRVALEIERQLSSDPSRQVPMNIDGATAVVYAELGFAPELARGLFLLSRSVGILAHSWEERQQGSRIKGPLPPPLLAAYDGPAPRRVQRPAEA